MALELVGMPMKEDLLDPIKLEIEDMEWLEVHTAETSDLEETLLELTIMILELLEWIQELELALVGLTLMLEDLPLMVMEQEE